MVGAVSEFETEEATGRTETLGSQRYAINEFLGSQYMQELYEIGIGQQSTSDFMRKRMLGALKKKQIKS